MKKALLPLVLAAAGALSACGGAPKLNESQEYFVGRSIAALAIEKERLYVSDAALERYVALVGLTVALESDRPETYKGYTFGVLDVEEPNAFCAPSGFIFVTKGLLKAVKNEDELAGVLAHEVAHIGLRHPEIAAQAAAEKEGLAEKAGQFQKAAGFVSFAAGVMGKKEVAQWATLAEESAPLMGKTVQAFHEQYRNGFSRDEEFAADAKAVDFMSRPGVRYAPEAYKDFIARLPKKGGAYGTHPDLEGRVQALEEAIKKLGVKIPVDPARAERFKAATAGLKGN